MPVLNQPIDKLITSDDLINMTSQPLTTTSSPAVYVIRGDVAVTDAPQTWIEYVDEIMTSQTTETWVLLGCTFTSALIFIFSMLFIMLNCVCTRRRSGEEKKKGEKRSTVTSSAASSRKLVTSSSSSSNQQSVVAPMQVVEEMREEPQVVVAKQPPAQEDAVTSPTSKVTSQIPQVSLESEIGNWLMKRNMRNNNLGEFPPKIPQPPPVVAR